MLKIAILTCLAFSSIFLMGAPNFAHAQEAEGAEAAPVSQQYPAPSPETFGTAQFVLSGNPVVPPRDYSKGIMMPSPKDYQSNESGRIYDVVFLGLAADQMQFEIRGYGIADLQYPETGQTIEFPSSLKRVEIRDLVINIDEVTSGSITYRVQRLQ